jgi:hypothetical protein
MSQEEAEEFRRSVTRRISSRSPEITLNQEGRVRLISGTTALGLTYYGFAVPGAFNVDETKTAVALYMLTAASSFFIPYIATGNTQVTDAEASLSLYGALAGPIHGGLIYGIIVDDIDGPTILGISVVTGIAEAFAGYHIARANDLTEGKANVIAGIGTFGLGIGAGGAYLLGAEEERPYFAGMLIGTGAGFFAGNVLSNMQPFSAGDAEVLLTSGTLGAYTPVALLLLFESRDEDLYVSSAMLGSLAGLLLGDHLEKGREFSDAQGNYITLGTLAGTALGLGTAYLISSDDENEQMYAAASLVGSVGGFALMYSLLEDDARVGSKAMNWNFDISPVGIGSLLFGDRPRSGTMIPIASFQYRFDE